MNHGIAELQRPAFGVCNVGGRIWTSRTSDLWRNFVGSADERETRRSVRRWVV